MHLDEFVLSTVHGLLEKSGGDEACATRDADRTPLERGDGERETLRDEALPREVETGAEQCQTQAMTGQAGAQAESERDDVPVVDEVKEADEHPSPIVRGVVMARPALRIAQFGQIVGIIAEVVEGVGLGAMPVADQRAPPLP